MSVSRVIFQPVISSSNDPGRHYFFNRSSTHRAAASWLREHSELEIAIPAIVLGEFAEGFENAERPVIEHYRTSHRILEMDENVAMIYARVSSELRKSGASLGVQDAWIAATALSFQIPLLTRNVSHFHCIKELKLEGYV